MSETASLLDGGVMLHGSATLPPATPYIVLRVSEKYQRKEKKSKRMNTSA
jgi:hypothetical protein